MIINNIPKPEVSNDFTIKDIHRIRAWEYERLKDATRDEYLSDTAQRTEDAIKKMGL